MCLDELKLEGCSTLQVPRPRNKTLLICNRNRNLQSSKAPVKSQAQGTSLFNNIVDNIFDNLLSRRFLNKFVRITAKSPRVDDRSPLDLEAEHGETMDDMYDEEVEVPE